MWGLSALTFMLAAVTGHVGFTTDGTCWMEGGYIFLFYVPLYIYWVFCFVSLMVVAKTLSSMQSTNSVVTTTIKRSVSLTLAFVLMWLWGAIFRIHEYTNNFIPTWLIVIQAFYLGKTCARSGSCGFGVLLLSAAVLQSCVVAAQAPAAL